MSLTLDLLMMTTTLMLTSGSEVGEATAVSRDFFGDIFRMSDCEGRCDAGGTRPAMHVPSRPCYCQCAPTHLAYREDKQQCVKDIKECYMSVFYRPFTVEAIPLVYLPTSGQLVHPDAHLSLAGRKPIEGGAFPTCKASVSQYLTKEGWRTLTKVDGGGPVFGLFTDGNKTFLQFLGNSQDRRVLQQHLALVRLFCKIPQYASFETCVAIRVGWVPGIDALEDEGLPSTRTNMMVIGLSIGVLGLVYVLAVLIYLKIRRQQIAKRKSGGDQEACIPPRDDDPDKPSNPNRLETSKRLELYHTSSLRSKAAPWTTQLSSLVETYNRTWTLGGQPGCEFKAQELQPELFEPEYMASPPQHVLEYLQRLQSSVAFARHRLRSCYRYQPTLNGIPEDDYYYQELERKGSEIKEMRTTPDGGSASSVTSLLESEDQDTDGTRKKKHQKIPPKKPRRKSKLKSSKDHEVVTQSSDQEQEIQNAMNTLNETLEALEFDIYQHDLMHKETGVSCPNSTEGELDEFDTSSCSSLSAVTVLGRDIVRKNGVDMGSTGSRTMERNLSEEFSTFRNSVYSGREAAKSPVSQARSSSRNSVSESDVSTEAVSELNKVANESVRSSNHDNAKPLKNNKQTEVTPVNNKNHADSNQRTESRNTNNESSGSRDSSVSRKHRRKPPEPKPRVTLNGTAKASTSKEGSGPSPPPKPCHDDVNPPPTTEEDKSRLLKKSSSSESMTTTSTDMTSDSLDSRSSSPSQSSLSPSLVDLWLTKLIQTSVVQSSKSRRKSKKKLVLPDTEDGGAWEHVCNKQPPPPQDPSCPLHDLKDSEPNLIDKLAHYSSKTMAGRDVAGYFQSLKQDVLKEHLKSWLVSNGHGKNHKKGISVKCKSKESGHTKPLVTNGKEVNLVGSEHGVLWTNFNKTVNGGKESSKSSGHCSMDSTCELIDFLDSEKLSSGRSDGNVISESAKVI